MKNLMKKAREAQKDERGLTLVELLAVVVILAIVAAIAFVLIGNVIENSKEDAHIANASQLIASAKLYEASVDEIGSGVTAEDLQKADLLGVLIDPWKKVEYTAVKAKTAKVTKTDQDYAVVLVTNEEDKCSIDNTEKELIEDGGDLCQ